MIDTFILEKHVIFKAAIVLQVAQYTSAIKMGKQLFMITPWWNVLDSVVYDKCIWIVSWLCVCFW